MPAEHPPFKSIMPLAANTANAAWMVIYGLTEDGRVFRWEDFGSEASQQWAELGRVIDEANRPKNSVLFQDEPAEELGNLISEFTIRHTIDRKPIPFKAGAMERDEWYTGIGTLMLEVLHRKGLLQDYIDRNPQKQGDIGDK